MVGVGWSAPMSSTSPASRPISSSDSRSAVRRRSVSSSSCRPPGNEISPAWRRMSSRRLVKTACSAPPLRERGTRPAASMRPCTSSPAAASESRRTPRRRSATSVRERDALDTLVEHDLAVERAVHRALGGDDAQALDLALAERVGEAHDDVEARRAAAVGRRVVAGDLDAARVPALALGVHLHRDGGTGGEAGREQLERLRPRVRAAPLGTLVDRQLVAADLDGVAEPVLTGRGGLHRRLILVASGQIRLPARYSSGLKTRPVGILGKKYVVFGGMLTPVAAISRTCATGVGRRKNAAS